MAPGDFLLQPTSTFPWGWWTARRGTRTRACTALTTGMVMSTDTDRCKRVMWVEVTEEFEMKVTCSWWPRGNDIAARLHTGTP